MRRREFGKTSLGLLGGALLANRCEAAAAESPAIPTAMPAVDFPKTAGLTKYVGQFVLQTKYENIPAEVTELGKKSILDGFGLALAGSRAESGPISRKYIEQCGGNGKATVIGTAMKTSSRFAALLNGISIHADDFDDTQLAAAKDRVYGLLMHPTVPVLPAIFALAEQRSVSGKEWLLAYQVGAEVECKIAEAI
jgi:2-methylcitrate dehydratase PrpD